MNKEEVLQVIKETGLISVIRGMEPAKMANIAKALEKGGVKVMEITMNSDQPLKMIEEVKALTKDQDVVIGAGTVLDPETARAAILAGAEFVFSPTLNVDVIELCRRYDKLVIPGVMTPTEILTAVEAGADVVKVFPAGIVGSKFIKSVKAPLDNVNIIPTGGISLDNAAEYIQAGAMALGVGGGLLDSKIIDNGEFDKLTEKAKSFIDIVKETRN